MATKVGGGVSKWHMFGTVRCCRCVHMRTCLCPRAPTCMLYTQRARTSTHVPIFSLPPFLSMSQNSLTHTLTPSFPTALAHAQPTSHELPPP